MEAPKISTRDKKRGELTMEHNRVNIFPIFSYTKLHQKGESALKVSLFESNQM